MTLGPHVPDIGGIDKGRSSKTRTDYAWKKRSSHAFTTYIETLFSLRWQTIVFKSAIIRLLAEIPPRLLRGSISQNGQGSPVSPVLTFWRTR